MILSEFIRAMDIGWTDFLWGLIWLFIFVGINDFMIYSTAWKQGRISFIKNVLPDLHGDIVKELQQEKKKLIKEKKDLLMEIGEYKAKLNVIRESLK